LVWLLGRIWGTLSLCLDSSLSVQVLLAWRLLDLVLFVVVLFVVMLLVVVLFVVMLFVVVLIALVLFAMALGFLVQVLWALL